MLFQRDFLIHLASSFFSCSIPCKKTDIPSSTSTQGFHQFPFTVSSFQIALNCVKSIIIVKTANKSASNVKNNNKKTVAGGEQGEHSLHSCLIHMVNWLMTRNRECADMLAIQNCKELFNVQLFNQIIKFEMHASYYIFAK